MNEIKELLLRLVQRMEAIEERLNPPVVDVDPGKPNLRRVIEVFEARPDEWLTSGTVAKLAGIGTSSARMILYGHKETFMCERMSPGRVRWRLSPGPPPRSARPPSAIGATSSCATPARRRTTP